MDVRVVPGPAAARDALRQAASALRPHRVLVSDVPGSGRGFELVRAIRQDPEIPPLATVLIASAGRTGDADRCRELGIAACLTGPVTRTELRDALCRALGGEISEAESGPKARPESPGPTRRLRVLLAEDNLVNQRVATRLLEREGHVVTLAANGAEAVAAFSQGEFDLVLMDVQMPEMDGLEATRRIRAAKNGDRVPIVALTAFAMKSDEERCLQAKMNGYLSKPITAARLNEMIERVVLTPQ
jgi:CheY-like chemotaxis protein